MVRFIISYSPRVDLCLSANRAVNGAGVVVAHFVTTDRYDQGHNIDFQIGAFCRVPPSLGH